MKGPGLAIVFGGPKGGDKKPEGASSPLAPGGGDPGGGMEGARKDATRAVARALGADNADLDSLDSALQAFVEACGSSGYSDKE